MSDSLIVGVDGCRAGWVACPSRGDIQIFSEFTSLIRHFPSATLLVDIPQGLPAHDERDLERKIRERLTAHKSSVFSVPCREAVYAKSYEQACRINSAEQGKKLSLQAWYICPKIREVDQALQKTKSWQRRIYEAHPELCFHEIAGGKLLASKKTPEGVNQRLALLRKYDRRLPNKYSDALENIPRKLAARDDLLDALVLMLVGRRGFSLMRGDVKRDEQGVAIRLAVPA